MACLALVLCRMVNFADSNDRLIMLARIGAMMLMFVFSSAVGKGSREQDLRGHLFTSRVIAVAVVDVNADIVQCS